MRDLVAVFLACFLLAGCSSASEPTVESKPTVNDRGCGHLVIEEGGRTWWEWDDGQQIYIYE